MNFPPSRTRSGVDPSVIDVAYWLEATNFTLGTDVGSRSEAEVPFASEAQLCSGVMGLVVRRHLVD